MKVAMFVNFSDKDFQGKWGGEITNFPAGSSSYMEEWKARHFAKHLVQRELFKEGIEVSSHPREAELTAKAVILEVEEKSTTQVESEVIDRNEKKKSTKKAPKVESKKEEKEFEGLND